MHYIYFHHEIRVGKTSFIKIYIKGNFSDKYNQTQLLDVNNKKIHLENINDKTNPYSQYSHIQLRIFDLPGDFNLESNTNSQLFSGTKALFFIFDVTNPNALINIKKKIAASKLFFKNNKDVINLEDSVIKPPDTFREIPIAIIGNKIDMIDNINISNRQIEEFVINLNREYNFAFINFYEISVKANSGIDDIFQDIIFYYFKRKIDIFNFNHNEMNENSIYESIINKKENPDEIKKTIEQPKIQKPSLNKGMLAFNQILDNIKKNLNFEISSLKEENKKEIEKNKKLEEKIEIITNNFNKENNELKEKINIFENKTNELEKQLKSKDEEIENLKQKVNNLILLNDEITLKFRVSDKNDKNQIEIKTTGETKISEVRSMLYELFPKINDMNIKGLCLEGKENEKLDEMKTVKENKLVNGSLIALIV